MRIGIQAKLVGTLFIAGFVPLAMSLGTIVFTLTRVRTQSVGQAFRATAQQEASLLSALLFEEVQALHTLSRLPGTREFLEAADRTPIDRDQIASIEAKWPELRREDSPLSQILNNPLALRWQAAQTQQARLAEVMVTDAHGRLIAATNKTSDYFQADEDWWQASYAGGAGKLLIQDVSFDESAISGRGTIGALVANICIPLYSAPEEPARKVVGILKASLDAAWLVDQMASMYGGGYAGDTMWLLHENGSPVPGSLRIHRGQASNGDFPVIPRETLSAIRSRKFGWMEDAPVVGHQLLAFAAVRLPGDAIQRGAQWYVIVATDRAEALAPIRRVGWFVFIAGAVVILLCFAGGWLVARNEIIRPLLMLRRGALELERGNIDFRLVAPGDAARAGAAGTRVFRNDEIGGLARGFNRMADEMRDQLQRLEHADRIKHQFIDVASHELRTPVTYIVGATQLIQRGTGPLGACAQGPCGPVLAKIISKGQRLGRIVENMMKLLQEDNYGSMLNVSPVNLAALTDAVQGELEPFLKERGQKLSVSVAPDTPTIRADEEKVRDILMNLLSNAVRFSPDDSTIELMIAGTETGGAEFSVRDRGSGIPAADLPVLFEPFAVAAASDSERHMSGEYEHGSRGIGLGLSVVKRFVELHGGSVRVESSPQGTTFRVILPAAPARTDEPAEGAKPGGA